VRIVGGRLGGRRFPGPPGDVTRPTAERAREGIASALEARNAISGRRTLDLYAGTGALGFEALSRGARHVVFVERDARVARALQSSADSLGVRHEIEVLRLDLSRERSQAEVLKRGPFGLVLMDPPYADLTAAVALLGALCRGGLLAEDAVVLLEHAAKDTPILPVNLVPLSRYRYGDTAVVLLEASVAPEVPEAQGDDLP